MRNTGKEEWIHGRKSITVGQTQFVNDMRSVKKLVYNGVNQKWCQDTEF